MWRDLIIQVPIINILIAVALITGAVILGRLKFAVLFSYLSMYHWVFFVNRSILEAHSDTPTFYLASFIITGVAITVICIWMFMTESD